ncbi:hypothetical protein QFC21_001907, partial [Naganishia friedmannii]
PRLSPPTRLSEVRLRAYYHALREINNYWYGAKPHHVNTPFIRSVLTRLTPFVNSALWNKLPWDESLSLHYLHNKRKLHEWKSGMTPNCSSLQLLLNFVGNHQALDGTGQEQVAYSLNKACQGIPFTEDEIRIGNLTRSTIVSLLDDSWQPSPDSQYLKVQRAVSATPDSLAMETKPTTKPRWVDVVFSGAALSKLKAKAYQEISSGFVSTDDALTALIWQSVSRARLARLPASKESTMGRAINPRRYLGIPATYPGYISNMAYTTATLDQLATRNLGAIAADLRAAVDPETSGLERTTREFATLLYRAQDKDSVSANDSLNLGSDVMLSSWANMRCYDFDFGMQLGAPVAFRRTLMDPVPSLMFLLPKRKDGEIVVTMCALEEDLKRLKQDKKITHYGQFLE